MTVHTPHTRSHLSSVPLDQDIHRLCLGRGHLALLLVSRSFVSQDSHGSMYACEYVWGANGRLVECAESRIQTKGDVDPLP